MNLREVNLEIQNQEICPEIQGRGGDNGDDGGDGGDMVTSPMELLGGLN